MVDSKIFCLTTLLLLLCIGTVVVLNAVTLHKVNAIEDATLESSASTLAPTLCIAGVAALAAGRKLVGYE